MHFLLTNDDGIDAPGLAALEAAVRSVGEQCTIVAPAMEFSQCGHRVTTRSALRVEPRGENRHAVHGTPADCVRLALFALGVKPDVVVSGVNHGGNMGQDLVISGTVAAVREAAYQGLKAIAFSHYLISGTGMDWPRVTAWTAEIAQRLLSGEHKDGEYWNVNFPHLPPGEMPFPKAILTAPARSPLKVSFSTAADGAHTLHEYAGYADRPQDEGSDVAACFSGKISISRLNL